MEYYSYSSKNGRIQLIEWLYDNKYLSSENLDLKDKDGNTPLMSCVIAGNLDLVQCLYKYGASLNVKNKEGRNTLFLAVLNKKIEIVEWLLNEELKACLSFSSEQDIYRYTIFHQAAYIGDLEIVKLLIQRLPELMHSIPNDKKSPIKIAEEKNHIVVASFLNQALEQNKNDVQLIRSVVSGNHVNVSASINAGANPNVYSKQIPLLLYTVENGKLNVLEKLIKSEKLNINVVRPDNGNNALHVACSFDIARDIRIKIIKILIDTGVDFNALNYDSLTSLKLAEEKPLDEEVLKILREAIEQKSKENKKSLQNSKEETFFQSTPSTEVRLSSNLNNKGATTMENLQSTNFEKAVKQINELLTQAKTYKKDKTADACLKAMECCGMAVAMLRAVKKEALIEEEKKAYQNVETQINDDILFILKNEFIYDQIGIASNLQTSNLAERLKNHQIHLRLIRDPNKFDASDITTYQTLVTKELKKLFKELVQFCQNLLGFTEEQQTQGCTIVILGSLAMQQAFPYSDVEYVILLDENKAKENRARYEALARLIEIMVVSFGETSPVYAESLKQGGEFDFAYQYLIKGFRIDSAKNPKATDWRLSLVNTIKGYTSADSLRTFRSGNHLAASLLMPEYLLGDKNLFGEYKKELLKKIELDDGYGKLLKDLLGHDLQALKDLIRALKLNEKEKLDLKLICLPSVNIATDLMLMLYRFGKIPAENLSMQIQAIINLLKPYSTKHQEIFDNWVAFIKNMFVQRQQIIMNSSSHNALVSSTTLNLENIITQLELILKIVKELRKVVVLNNQNSKAKIESVTSSSSSFFPPAVQPAESTRALNSGDIRLVGATAKKNIKANTKGGSIDIRDAEAQDGDIDLSATSSTYNSATNPQSSPSSK